MKYPGAMSQLLFTDTDSLLYEIRTNDIKDDAHLFDFSDYDENHPCFFNANKKNLC